jgi:hypothetical protein
VGQPLTQNALEQVARILGALPPGIQLALVAGLFVLALYLGWAARRWWRGLRVRMRAARAQRGELLARWVLQSAGYRIVGDQVACTWPVQIDGRAHDIELRVDYLVERGGLRYVADAKTGRWASSLNNGATRRQLLEYWLAYEADGVLLVDTEKRSVRQVSFPALG